ncbi:hypothetical protein NLI96_g4211 [Meripilus lineatus]|uniref:Major facilitator superfamily (MFS) profile domain-containing protein n=1 Tax=Meripilus lineatus TaxID=2056292 RepID=A0AAD5V512_9APHY|nr:hypothetical protein NLI96_g4211 [Physisporinus lineatus]
MQPKVKSGLITATICLVTFLSIFLTGATTVALTTIGNDLKFKQADLQWPLNVYASIGAAFAPRPWAFILFLGMQGIGSAANIPSGISIISSYFPPGKAKNQAFALLGAGQPIGYMIGMILGGILTDSGASWRAIYWLQAGLGCLLCGLGWYVLPEDEVSKRYDKGLDIIGAILSTCGLGLLVQSTTAPRGWATPFVPSLLGTAIILIVSFVLWEIRREAKGQSVLLPMSMFSQPGAKMGPVVLLVVFGWWGFNTQGYFIPLFFQQVKGLSPLKTALWLVPSGVSGLITNLVTGYLIAVVPGQILVIVGLLSCIVSCVLFAVIQVQASYWAMSFIIVITLPILDLAYTVANLQVCSSFAGDSQALAGSIFSVATRLGTSIGLAVTSSIATSVSLAYNKKHPDLSATDPQVLLAGFRSAGWTCTASLLLSLAIAIVGLRGVGLVGQRPRVEKVRSDLELNDLGNSRWGTQASELPVGTTVTETAVRAEREFEFGSSSKTGTVIPSEKSSIKEI